MVTLVRGEVFAQTIDAGGKQRNLDLGEPVSAAPRLKSPTISDLRSVDSAIVE